MGVNWAGLLGLALIISGQKRSLENRDFIGVLLAFVAALFYALIPNFDGSSGKLMESF